MQRGEMAVASSGGGTREKKTDGGGRKRIEKESRKQTESERQEAEVLHGALVSQRSRIKEGWRRRRRRNDEGAKEMEKIRYEGTETVKENV